MVQEISNGDRFTVSGKIGKDFGEGFVVAKFSVVNEQHDGHGGELFGERGEAEIRLGVNFGFRTKIADAFGSQVEVFAAVPKQDSETGFLGLNQSCEHGVFRAFHWFTARLTAKFLGAKQGEKYCPNSHGEIPTPHVAPQSGSKSITFLAGVHLPVTLLRYQSRSPKTRL